MTSSYLDLMANFDAVSAEQSARHGLVRIRLGGLGCLYVNAEQARELLKAAAEAVKILEPPVQVAGEMDAETARQQPATEVHACYWCGHESAIGMQQRPDMDGKWECTDTAACRSRAGDPDGLVLLAEAEQDPCPQCGDTVSPKADNGYCWNLLQCAGRAQARDTAKAGAV